MQSRDEEVWHWSDALLEIVEDWIREPLPREGARLDGGWHGGRLRRLRRQIESARKLYREGQGEPLRVLYSRWRTIAGGDMRKQVKFALQDLPPLSSSVERLSGPPWARRRGTVRGREVQRRRPRSAGASEEAAGSVQAGGDRGGDDGSAFERARSIHEELARILSNYD